MKIIDFVRQFAPSFRKDDVAEKLRLLREALDEQSIQPYQLLIETPIKGTSKAVQTYEKEFARLVRTPFKGNWVEVTLQVLSNINANIGLLETLVEKNYAKDIIATGMTFKKAEILRVIAIADFVTTYSRQQLLYLLAAEANVEAKSLPQGKERPAPELAWLEANRDGFFKCLPVMSLKAHELQAALNDIPDIIINEDSANLTEKTIGSIKLDPLAAGLIPITWNPFYFIGVRMANRENARINRAKSEKRAIEFRLEQLRMQARGQQDPKLEKTIAFYEDEANLLAAKIAKYED